MCINYLIDEFLTSIDNLIVPRNVNSGKKTAQNISIQIPLRQNIQNKATRNNNSTCKPSYSICVSFSTHL